MLKEVVLCKDCKHMVVDSRGSPFDWVWPDGECPFQSDDPFYSTIPHDDDFCSRGEEKD